MKSIMQQWSEYCMNVLIPEGVPKEHFEELRHAFYTGFVHAETFHIHKERGAFSEDDREAYARIVRKEICEYLFNTTGDGMNDFYQLAAEH